MADNYKTQNAITVRADAYDPANPTALCVIDKDWSRLDGIGAGHKVLVSGGYVRPKSGDYIITKGANTFVIDATTFAVLFTTV